MDQLLTKKIPTTAIFAAGLMAILIMMVLPVPPMALDLGLMVSFGFAILIFTVTLFVERPLDFSSFPAILLVSLLLRLALNISSTKLIIGEGHTGTDAAGGVIEGFAMFIMGGNLGLGLVIFSVLIIVNFMVITKGAGRMAEVGARFALDAMPGKQMAIDADVAAGAISHEEAKRLREREQEETAFLGSLDGASKFVKGDAVAGLLITLLNLVAGIAIGILVHGISFGEALQNYSILTVGDGLVSQIPAVIISVAAALLLSKGRGDKAVDAALIHELGDRPEAVVTVACVLCVFGFFPGLPFVPFALGAAGLGALAMYGFRRRKEQASIPVDQPAIVQEAKPGFGDLLDIDDIHIDLSPDLVGILVENDGGLDDRIERIRRYVVEEFGFILPPVRVTDKPGADAGTYTIKLQGVAAASNTLRPGQHLALIGDDEYTDILGDVVQEPVYGARARWVGQVSKDRLVAQGETVVQPVEVVTTHLLETVQANFSRLVTRRSLRAILDAYCRHSDSERAEANRRLIDEFIPEKVDHSMVQLILKDLLSERIPIRNLPLILEAAVEARAGEARLDDVMEHVRRRMAFQFIPRFTDDKKSLDVLQLGEAIVEKVSSTTVDNPTGLGEGAGVVSEFMSRLRAQIEQANAAGPLAIATPGALRRWVRRTTSANGLSLPVLSYEEIAQYAKPNIVGTV